MRESDVPICQRRADCCGVGLWLAPLFNAWRVQLRRSVRPMRGSSQRATTAASPSRLWVGERICYRDCAIGQHITSTERHAR